MSEDDVPRGWRLALPPELAARERYSLGIGPFGSNLKVNDYRTSGVPLVFVRNIRAGSFQGRDSKFVSASKAEELHPHQVLPGDVLITKMGDPPGDSNVYPERLPPAIITADCIRWRLDPNLGVGWFFAYATRSRGVRAQIVGKTQGVAQKKISLARFSQVLYPVPPLPEQRRIVAEIEKQFTRLDAAVATLEQVRAKLKRARASVLKAAVEGRLVPTEASLARAEGRTYEPASVLLERILEERKRKDVNARRKHQAPLDLGVVGELPQGWAWATMDVLLSAIETGKSFRCDSATPKADEVGIVKVSAVTWGTYDEAESKTVDDPAKVNPSYFIEDGDFLFSRANTIDLVGACVIAAGVTRRIMLSDKILRFRMLDRAWNPWVLQVLRSQHGRRQIQDLATGNQESMRNIGQDRIRQILIPIPPRVERDRIVQELDRRLSVLDALERTVERNLQRCARLRQSILKRAFEGKLVPQDPTDEPASALLARIQAQTIPDLQAAGK